MRKRLRKEGIDERGQSAVEYLMTYGWAILLIALIVTALYYTGVFNYNNLVQKSLPGSCFVSRPNGPGSTIEISTSGLCSGLPPQSVAVFVSSSYINTPSVGFPLGSAPSSLFAWVYPTSDPASWAMVQSYGPSSPGTAQTRALSISSGGDLCFNTQGDDACSSLVVPLNKWSFVGYTTTGGLYVTLYSNTTTQNVPMPTQAPATVAGLGHLGTYIGGSGSLVWSGFLANIQLYNTSISSNAVNAIYLSGIGGTPINLQKLVGWWPLNGNANDYSGNNDNGTVSGVQYSTNWQSGYSQP